MGLFIFSCAPPPVPLRTITWRTVGVEFAANLRRVRRAEPPFQESGFLRMLVAEDVGCDLCEYHRMIGLFIPDDMIVGFTL